MANREIDIGHIVHPLVRITESSIDSFGEGIYLGHKVDMSQVMCTPDEMLKPIGLSAFWRNASECVELKDGGLVWQHEYVQLVSDRLFKSFNGEKKFRKLSSMREDDLLTDGDVSYDEHIPYDEWYLDADLEQHYEIDPDVSI